MYYFIDFLITLIENFYFNFLSIFILLLKFRKAQSYCPYNDLIKTFVKEFYLENILKLARLRKYINAKYKNLME